MKSKPFLTPESAEIYLTYLCDLSCPFCFYRIHQQKNNKDLPPEAWLKLIDELKELGVLRVTLAGGEPLVYSGLSAIIEKIVASQMRFSIVTNGVLMRKRGQSIIENGRRCDWVQVSIDGMKQAHDSMRGSGNWEKSIDALRWVKDSGISTRVNSTISSVNLKDVPEMAKFLCEDVGVDSIRFNTVSAIEDVPLLDGVKPLSYRDMAEHIKIVADIADKYPAITRNSLSLLALNRFRNPKMVVDGKHRQCSSLLFKLAFRADGAIIPCLGCEGITLGKINETPIRDIWNNDEQLNYFRNRIDDGRCLEGECINCKYNYYCSYLCPADIKNVEWCFKKLEVEVRKLEQELGCQII